MVTIELKSKIIEKLKNFPEQNLYSGAIDLFSLLGYNTERNPGENNLSPEDFLESYDQQEIFNREKGEVSDWKSVSLLFQLTDSEIGLKTGDLFQQGEDIRQNNSYLFFAIELTDENYSRTRLGNITREINKLFKMPVLVLFRHGGYITLSIIYRRVNLRDGDKDVLQKVTLIKDIRLDTPHRAHTEILFDFSFTSIAEKFAPDSFISLDNAWRKVLDTKELNKKFFKSLANWYFFAQDKVKFPNDLEQEEPGYSQLSLIRLITRLIFVWFIREKNLINPDLFKPDKLKNIIKDFNKSPGSNNYYRAILQNLFFATLNKSANEREFIKDGDFNTNRDQYGVKNLYRYKSLFQTDEITALELFNDTPFLNGGLFECLDIEQEDKKVKYVDGFSRNPAKMANVPDSLFFGEFDNVDLSTFYDDKKRKKEGVSGLITLFENYKFTVEENTPVEEEVALDPELLGKVFENLLANYNPETKTTARKQTGSFYTPREIVNYMVDESLIAYLKQKLGEKISGYSKLGADTGEFFGNDTRAGQLEIESAESGSRWDGKEEELETELRYLLSYNEYTSRFSEEEKKLLVEAVHESKILDPACGSGAFPMGVLQKLVHLLNRLDNNNIYWKELQIVKASADTRDAFSNIDEEKERNKRIDEIKNNKMLIKHEGHNTK